MVIKVIVPDLGATGGDVLLTQWLVAEGDFVESGTPLFVVETDKATDEVQAFRSGYLRRILSPDGAEVELGSVVALMTDAADEVFDDNFDSSTDASNDDRLHATKPPISSPSAPTTSKVRASPRARKLAEERSIDLSEVPATAADGVISVADVERFAAGASRGSPHSRRVAISSRRRAIAEATTRSKFEIPHFYLFVEIDFTTAERARTRMRDRGESPPTYTELIVFASAQTLAEGSQLNSRLIDGHLEIYDHVDIGLMIGLESGVVAPVIRQANRMDLNDLRNEVNRLKRRAEAGELSTAEMQGGAFSISNLGMNGIDYFAGVIQPGQSCLLALGQIKRQPRYIEDRLESRYVMTACLSADHRITDGVGAARLLAGLKQRLESWSGT
jgi:pyruvate dehydrogenase E2 component (dihydrolipoamide acetyltransferase)